MTENYDDLGEAGGRVEFEHGAQAKAAVKSWRIEAFGRRPKDFLQRDLLFGSFERDRRLWAWRKLCKHRPPWMAEDTPGFPEPQRRQIIFQRSFHFLHQLQWMKLLEQADDHARRVLQQLRWCPPVGSEVRWNGDPRMPVRNCGRIQDCPFCFARQVSEVFEQIAGARSPAPNRRGFLLLTATVTENELHEAGITDSYHFARRSLLSKMKDKLKSFGAVGGLVTLQVGPSQQVSHQWYSGELNFAHETGFEYHVGVLGEFPVNANTLRTLRAEEGMPSINARGFELHPNLSVVNHLDQNSVRIVLAGHMSAYNGEQKLPDGRGLFVWPSLVLANYPQWRGRLDLLQNRHLYDRWGSWVGLEPVSREPRLPLGPRRPTGLERSRHILHNMNRDRRREAEERTDTLWRQHGERIRQIAARHGKPIGRAMILSGLADAGITITERESRRLAHCLKQEVRP